MDAGELGQGHQGSTQSKTQVDVPILYYARESGPEFSLRFRALLERDEKTTSAEDFFPRKQTLELNGEAGSIVSYTLAFLATTDELIICKGSYALPQQRRRSAPFQDLFPHRKLLDLHSEAGSSVSRIQNFLAGPHMLT